MKRSYECAYVTAIIDRGPVEKPAVVVLHHELEVLREVHGVVQVVPSDLQAGGEMHCEVEPFAEHERLVRKYGLNPESKVAHTVAVYGRADDARWTAALERSERFEASTAEAAVEEELGTFDTDDDLKDSTDNPDVIEELMTKAEIQEFLAAAAVKYDKRARKGALADLLAQSRGWKFDEAAD